MRSSLLVVLLAAMPRESVACPCITRVDSEANEVAQRSLVVVDADALTYVLQLAVEGDATELGWIVPTPAVPDAPTLADNELFSTLDLATAPFLWQCSSGSDGCSDSLKGNTLQRDAPDSTVVWSQGTLGNLDYAVLSATDGSDLLAWLGTHGYPVAASLEGVIDDYVARDFAFVALRVSGTALAAATDVLGPVSIRVPWTGTPVFPLGMTALGQSSRLSLLLYVAAAEKMGPSNYPRVVVDGGALRADEDGGSNYLELVHRAADGATAGFVVEWAGAASELALVATDPLAELLSGKQLVRLHTDVPPAKLAADLLLAPATDVVTPMYDCVPAAEEDSGGCAVIRGPLGPVLLLLGVGLGLRRRLHSRCLR
jgi:hypothetical protein